MSWLKTIYLTTLILCLSLTIAFAKPPTTLDEQPETGEIFDNSIEDVTTYINANRLLLFVSNIGVFGRDLSQVFNNDDGMYFPFTSIGQIPTGWNDNTVLYAAGLWMAGKVNGETRVAIAEYSEEYAPGPMANGTYQYDRPEFKVYKIYNDIQNDDYFNWPADQGAPVNNLGDPDMIGEQMLWTVFNDADPSRHTNDAGLTEPLGVEIQQTVWAQTSNVMIDTSIVYYPINVSHVGPAGGSVTVTIDNHHDIIPGNHMIIIENDLSLGLVWHLLDSSSGAIVLGNQPVETGVGGAGFANGMKIVLNEGANGKVESIVEISNGSGLLVPPVDVMWAVNSTGDWRVGSSSGDNFESMNWRGNLGQSDWEFRFTPEGSEYYQFSDSKQPDRAPFEVWNTGLTPDDPSDDVQLNFAFIDWDGNNYWSYSDRIYVTEIEYNEPNPAFLDDNWGLDSRLGRVVFDKYSLFAAQPETGTIVRLSSREEFFSPADTFYFSSPLFQTVPNGGENNVTYMKYKLYNKGNNQISDFYLSIWMDPDLGGSGDDLVGCDTLDDLFFCYNGDDDDVQYGDRTPSLGMKIIHGPLVQSSGDVADFDGTLIPDYKNIPMTAFSWYINGTDPDSFDETYNYMQGFDADGNLMPNGTRFAFPGDPVSGIGDIDFNPSDRRMMASFGPFNFNPGDSQYVFLKFAVGQGDDRLSSITRVKEILNSPMDPTPILKVVSVPDTLSMLMLQSINPLTVKVLFGLDENNQAEVLVDNASVVINNLPSPDSTVVLASYDGFDGEVYCYYYNPRELLTSYHPLWDYYGHPVAITGQFVGGDPILLQRSVIISGNRRGDLNLDGRIDITDLTLMVGYIVRNETLQYPEAADIDQSGTITITDLTLMVNKLFRTSQNYVR